MQSNRAKKITLIVLAVIIGILFIAVGAGIGVYQFYIKPHYLVTQTENGEKKQIDANDILNQVETVLQEEDVKSYINENNPNESEELLGTIEEAKERNEKKNESASSSGGTQKSRVEKAKEQIEPKDLKDGMALAAKVDPGYILGLLSGGLTPEERQELKNYLTSRLSSSEISRGIQLFSKYSYLL